MGVIPEKLVTAALAMFQIRIAPEASQLQILVGTALEQGLAAVMVKGFNIGKEWEFIHPYGNGTTSDNCQNGGAAGSKCDGGSMPFV